MSYYTYIATLSLSSLIVIETARLFWKNHRFKGIFRSLDRSSHGDCLSRSFLRNPGFSIRLRPKVQWQCNFLRLSEYRVRTYLVLSINPNTHNHLIVCLYLWIAMQTCNIKHDNHRSNYQKEF